MTESDVIFANLEIIRVKCEENSIYPHYYLWFDKLHISLNGYTLKYEEFRSNILRIYSLGYKITDGDIRCDIDIPGLSGHKSPNKPWDRVYNQYWSIDIRWLLSEEFMKNFESELSQRVLYSLFK